MNYYNHRFMIRHNSDIQALQKDKSHGLRHYQNKIDLSKYDGKAQEIMRELHKLLTNDARGKLQQKNFEIYIWISNNNEVIFHNYMNLKTIIQQHGRLLSEFDGFDHAVKLDEFYKQYLFRMLKTFYTYTRTFAIREAKRMGGGRLSEITMLAEASDDETTEGVVQSIEDTRNWQFHNGI